MRNSWGGNFVRPRSQALWPKTRGHGACILDTIFAGSFNRCCPILLARFLAATMGYLEIHVGTKPDGSRLRRPPMFEGLFQPMHLMIIAGIALLIFGPKKLPELGKGLGESIRGFKSAIAAPDEEKRPAAKTDTTRA